MHPCTKCGGVDFKIEATYAALNHVRLIDDDFEVIDINYGDGEWDDDSTVRCCGCGEEWEYRQWKDRVPPARDEEGESDGD